MKIANWGYIRGFLIKSAILKSTPTPQAKIGDVSFIDNE